MEEKLVTVILPVYNAAPYLRNAIDSVLAQTHKKFELIAINDGSTDNSGAIIKEYSDPRIRYIEQENKGASAARNRALEIMQGDYFCFFDADDYLPPHSLEARLQIFEADPSHWFVDGQVRIMSEDMASEVSSYLPSFKGNAFNELLRMKGTCFFGPSWMIRRAPDYPYKMHEDFTHAEDLYFYMQLSTMGTYSYTEKTVLHYRRGHESAMSNLNGLEKGYRSLITEIVARTDVSRYRKFRFRLRCTRLMSFSYLKKGKPGKAIAVIFNYLLG